MMTYLKASQNWVFSLQHRFKNWSFPLLLLPPATLLRLPKRVLVKLPLSVFHFFNSLTPQYAAFKD